MAQNVSVMRDQQLQLAHATLRDLLLCIDRGHFSISIKGGGFLSSARYVFLQPVSCFPVTVGSRKPLFFNLVQEIADFPRIRFCLGEQLDHPLPRLLQRERWLSGYILLRDWNNVYLLHDRTSVKAQRFAFTDAPKSERAQSSVRIRTCIDASSIELIQPEARQRNSLISLDRRNLRHQVQRQMQRQILCAENLSLRERMPARDRPRGAQRSRAANRRFTRLASRC